MSQQPTPADVTSNRPIRVVLIDDDETWTRTQRRLLERHSGNLSVSTATSYDAGQTAIQETDADCLVCDYQLGDGTGLDLLKEVREESSTLPFILVTGEGDEQVASDAISEQVTDYVRKAELGRQPTKLATRIENVVAVARTRQALGREREHKQALLDMVRAGSSTRADFGQQLCDHLVTTHDYACAWIGILDNHRKVVPLATAGNTAYLDATISPGKGPDSEGEPALAALATAEPVVTTPVDSASDCALDSSADTPWHESAIAHGFRSVAALPLVHEGVCFGVLSVYSRTEPQSKKGDRSILEEYARTCGYVFQTLAWQETLLSTSSTTVEFTLSAGRVPLLDIAAALPDGATIRADTVIPRNDQEVLYIATVEELQVAELIDNAADVRTVSGVHRFDTADHGKCGIVARRPVPEYKLACTGVCFEETVVEDGQAQIIVSLGEQTTVRQCLDALAPTSAVDSVTTRWMKPNRSPDSEADTGDQLTDRQREVLKLALEAGYFERPRRNNTSELAAVLDISRATFTQHLRAAQRKMLTPRFSP